MRRIFVWMFLISVITGPLAFSQATKPDPVKPDFNSPRQMDAVDSVFIEEMTWMEVRDAMRAGKNTVIVATGGLEQNGPYLVANKHNVVLRGTTEAIARKLGNALVAPIIGFVPEGDIDPPTLHMLYPTTVSLREDTYRMLLTDILNCYRVHGFDHVILIGDSGGNQGGMKTVAEGLSASWKGSKTKLHYIPEYYDYAGLGKWIESQGIKQTDEGLHDDFGMTAQMLAVDPASVRTNQRIKAGNFKINGIDLAPVEKTAEWGRKIINYRADQTVKVIQARINGEK